jgi:hypothetical protein
MRFLIMLLRIFVTAFGLSEPRPEEERKNAIFLFGTLAALALLLAGAAWLILNLAH